MGRNEEIWAGQSLNLAFKMLIDIRQRGGPVDGWTVAKMKDDFYRKAMDEFIDDAFTLGKIIFDRGRKAKFLEWGN